MKGILLYLVILAAVVASLGPLFYTNITWLLSERALTGLIEARFDFVLLYIALFSFFVIFLIYPFRGGKWQKCNIGYVAFIIALFTEMFGFPLTIYLMSSMVQLPPADFEPAVALVVDVPGLNFRLLTTSLVAGIVSIASVVLIMAGWREIHKNRKSGKLVTSGVYRYMRHPQYTGIMLIIVSWLFAWPTLPTLIMCPVLLGVYYRLAKREESHVRKEVGKQYDEYAKKVPMFLPGWNW